MRKEKILFFVFIFSISIITFTLYQQIDATSISLVNTKEGSITISSSTGFKLTGQAVLPTTITLPNGTSVSLSKIGYLYFPNGDLYLIPNDNFVQFSNGTIKVEKPHMNNLPAGTTYFQKPAWFDNLPSNANLVLPTITLGASGKT